MGDGTVKSPGYKTGFRIPFKGMRNKRRQTMETIRKAEMFRKIAAEKQKERRENEWQEEWGGAEVSQGSYR